MVAFNKSGVFPVMSLVPHIKNPQKSDHETPAVTENGMVWKSHVTDIIADIGQALAIATGTAEKRARPRREESRTPLYTRLCGWNDIV